MAKIGFIGEKKDLLVGQGDDFIIPVTTTNADGTPYDYTDCVITGIIKKKPKSTAITATFTVTLTDPTNGKYTFELPNSVTALIPCGDTLDSSESIYEWELKMTDASGKKRKLYYGNVYVFRQLGA